MYIIEMTRYGTQVAKVLSRSKNPWDPVHVVGAPGFNREFPNVPIAVQTLKNAGYRSSRRYEVKDDEVTYDDD